MIDISWIFSSFFALNVNKISYGKISRKNVGNVGDEKSFESSLLLPGEKRYFFFLCIKYGVEKNIYVKTGNGKSV